MINIELTKEQKLDLERRHRSSRDAHECDRIKAVLLRSEGWGTGMIARALRIEQSTVTRHLKDWLCEGKLTTDMGNSGKEKLTPEQTEELIAHLEEHLYVHQYQIAAYIKRRFGVEFTVAGMNKWLHRNGFVYKKPFLIPLMHSKKSSLDFSYINKQKLFLESSLQL